MLTRREYSAYVDAANTFPAGCVRNGFLRLLETIASYRVICHHLAPMLHDAIAACDDRLEREHLQSLLDELKQGEQ